MIYKLQLYRIHFGKCRPIANAILINIHKHNYNKKWKNSSLFMHNLTNYMNIDSHLFPAYRFPLINPITSSLETVRNN